MNYTLSQLISGINIDINRAIVFGEDYSLLIHKSENLTANELSPMKFLEQAENDFENRGQGALLNSITNAKRAIQCQVDQWISTLSLTDYCHSKKIRKIELLNQLGLAPRILRKVANARNLLEHEYKAPTIQEVEEALDIAGLFVGLSTRTFMPDFIILGNQEDFHEETEQFKNGLYFTFNSLNDKGGFIATAYANNSALGKGAAIFNKNDIFGEVIIDKSDILFLPITRLFLTVGTQLDSNNPQSNHKIKKALELFGNVLDNN